jgi:pyruvate kinase
MNNQNLRKTKIVATIGPATQQYENLKQAIEHGADIVRCNFSHGSYEEHKMRFENAKRIGKELGKFIPVMADLQGPKLRVGSFEGEKQTLKEGQEFTVDNDPKPGDSTRVQLPNIAVLKALDVGHFILIDDGKIKLQVIKKGDGFVKTKVVVGGVIKDRKGFNLPNTIVDLPILTDKDKKDLDFAMEVGFDLVAVSFAQTPDDMKKAREVIAGRAPIVCKVEKPTAAMEHLPEIIALSDAVMVARGDMGVEIGFEKVPAVQKRMIELCRDSRKPVIVATHMLESMMTGAFPTRAEVTDISHAVEQCTDCTMLSGETASGDYPNEAIAAMALIQRETENRPDYRGYISNFEYHMAPADGDDLAEAAVALSHKAAAVVVFSKSGKTAINISKHRPDAPVVSVCTDHRIAGLTGFLYGVIPVMADDLKGNDEDSLARSAAEYAKVAKKGDYIVVVWDWAVKTIKA